VSDDFSKIEIIHDVEARVSARRFCLIIAIITLLLMQHLQPADSSRQHAFANSSGFAATLNINGSIDLSNEFFPKSRTNTVAALVVTGMKKDGLSRPKGVQARFDTTRNRSNLSFE
jgi:hypothetical protein